MKYNSSNICYNHKKAAVELSISTLVIIVLAMSMLILGLVLVKDIFQGSIYNVNQMNDKVQDQINKLFSEDTEAVVYLNNNLAEIKQGKQWGVAFAIQNNIKTQNFKWNVQVSDSKVEDKCGVTKEEAEAWIVTGSEGEASISSGKKYYGIIRFNIPEKSVNDISSCIVHYNLNILDGDGKPYSTIGFDVDVK